jgi:hypothetical protein
VNPRSSTSRHQVVGRQWAVSAPLLATPVGPLHRPIEASKAAVGYDLFTSIRDIESVATTFRLGSIPAV